MTYSFICNITGLRLTLYVGKDDYIGMFSQDVGARIAVHPADETPFPEDRGVSAAPGMITSIGTRLVRGEGGEVGHLGRDGRKE